MIVDLVRVTTSDGIRLDGALRQADGDSSSVPLDALLLVHGTGANFYASSLLEAMAEHFAAGGIAALLANTRGRDIVYTAWTPGGARRLGAAYERVDDCRMDLAAWVAWLRERGYRRIGLVGHSLGAIKGVYALSQPDPPTLECLVAISPARLSYDHFVASPKGEELRRTLETAQRHVDEGYPDTLMEIEFPIPYVVAAAGYLDKYGPGERLNVLTHLANLPCPTLFTFGSIETGDNVAFRGLPENIEAAAPPQVQVATVAGADHVYSGVRTELIRRVESWLGRLDIT